MQTVDAHVSSILQKVVLFAGLDSEALSALGTRLRRRRVPKGHVLFMRGDPGDNLYIIESGTVKINLTSPEGKEITLALLGSGEFFGELALLDGLPRSSDALTMENCQFLLLGRGDFLQLIEERPRMALQLIEVLSRRLRSDNQLIQDAAFFDVPARLARVILGLADTLGQPVGSEVAISRRLTQTELAGMVGATRESVNRWLVYFERQGLIRRQTGLITVVKPDGLRKRIY
jgi:CRP-like cAMP-binding protein